MLPKEVLANVLFALAISLFLKLPGPWLPWRASFVGYLESVQKVWTLSATMVTFTLSFFLSQSCVCRAAMASGPSHTLS